MDNGSIARETDLQRQSLHGFKEKSEEFMVSKPRQ